MTYMEYYAPSTMLPIICTLYYMNILEIMIHELHTRGSTQLTYHLRTGARQSLNLITDGMPVLIYKVVLFGKR